jgi:hypothetical protein
LKANWDDEVRAAIDVPFNSFFGYVSGKPSMSSILLGSTFYVLFLFTDAI